jgi:hypothetical protein
MIIAANFSPISRIAPPSLGSDGVGAEFGQLPVGVLESFPPVSPLSAKAHLFL